MQYVEVLAPTVVVALLFWFVVRALFRVDRNERRAEAAVDRAAAERAAAERAQGPGAPRPEDGLPAATPERPAEPGNRGPAEGQDDAGR